MYGLAALFSLGLLTGDADLAVAAHQELMKINQAEARQLQAQLSSAMAELQVILR